MAEGSRYVGRNFRPTGLSVGDSILVIVLQIAAALVLMLVLPTGLGALVVAGPSSKALLERRLPVTTLLAAMWLIGVTLFATLQAMAALISLPFLAVSALLGLLGMAGLVLMWFLLPRIRPNWRHIGASVVLFALVLIATYGYHYFWLSKYPFSDIFQEVHTFVAVNFYQDTGAFDGLSTENYIPLRPALYVALKAVLDIDPLLAYWLLPLPLLLVATIASLGLARTLFESPLYWWGTACAIALASAPLFPTNGSVLAVGATILLSCVVALAPDSSRVSGRGIAGAALITVLVTMVAVLCTRYMVSVPVFIAVSVIAAIVTKLTVPTTSTQLGVLAVTLGAAGIVLHRASLIFIPAVVLAYLFFLIFQALLMNDQQRLAHRVIGVLLLCLCFVAAVFPALVVLEEIGLIAVSDAMVGVFSSVTHSLIGLNFNADSEILLGTGPRVAVIDLIRTVGPVTALVSSVVGIVSIWTFYLRQPAVAGDVRKAYVLGGWAWVCGLGIITIASTGAPFAYRVATLGTSMLAIAIASFAIALYKHHHVVIGRRLVGGIVASALILVFVSVLVYRPGLPFFQEGSEPYLALTLLPLMVMAIGAAAIGLGGMLSRVPIVFVGLSLLGANLAFSADRGFMSARLMTYSYGPAPPELSYISFYAPQELEAVRRLNGAYPNWIVISDPVTVGIARAFGGAISAYNYSNLDSVSAATRDAFGQIMKFVTTPRTDSGLEERVAAATTVCVAAIGQLVSYPSLDIAKRLRSPLDLAMERMATVGRAETTTDADPLVDRVSLKPDSTGAGVIELSKDGSEGTDWLLHTPLEATQLGKRLTAGPGGASWHMILVITGRTFRWLAGDENQQGYYFPYLPTLDRSQLGNLLGTLFPEIDTGDARVRAFDIACPLVPP